MKKSKAVVIGDVTYADETVVPKCYGTMNSFSTKCDRCEIREECLQRKREEATYHD